MTIAQDATPHLNGLNAVIAKADSDAIVAGQKLVSAETQRDLYRIALEAKTAEFETHMRTHDGTPPVGKRLMPVGACEGADLEKLINERFGMNRRYDSDSLDATKLRSFLAVDTMPPRMRVYSSKGLPSAWTPAVLDLIPSDGQTTVMVFQNEVERPEKNTDRARYLDQADEAITRLRNWADDRGRSDVLPGVAHMGWHEQDNDPATSTRLWFPRVPKGGRLPIVLELHPYDKQGTKSMKEGYAATRGLWLADGGVLWAIGETGSLGRSDAAEAVWIDQAVSDAYDDGALYFSFFDSPIGAAGDWTNTTPAVIAAIAKASPIYSK